MSDSPAEIFSFANIDLTSIANYAVKGTPTVNRGRLVLTSHESGNFAEKLEDLLRLSKVS